MKTVNKEYGLEEYADIKTLKKQFKSKKRKPTRILFDVINKICKSKGVVSYVCELLPAEDKELIHGTEEEILARREYRYSLDLYGYQPPGKPTEPEEAIDKWEYKDDHNYMYLSYQTDRYYLIMAFNNIYEN